MAVARLSGGAAMIVPGQRLGIVIATRPVVFRCGHDALAAIVQTRLGFDPHPGLVVVFRSKRMDRAKILVWDDEPSRAIGSSGMANGLVPIHKRLEASRFQWPQVQDGVLRISRAQYEALFEGLDWRRLVVRRVRAPGAAA